MEKLNLFLNTPSIKKTSERAELLKYFIDNVKNKEGKPYRPAFIASKLSLFTVKDLYYMQSECKDYVNRGGDVGKYFWSLFK